jgi:hypothetical protein
VTMHEDAFMPIFHGDLRLFAHSIEVFGVARLTTHATRKSEIQLRSNGDHRAELGQRFRGDDGSVR